MSEYAIETDGLTRRFGDFIAVWSFYIFPVN